MSSDSQLPPAQARAPLLGGRLWLVTAAAVAIATLGFVVGRATSNESHSRPAAGASPSDPRTPQAISGTPAEDFPQTGPKDLGNGNVVFAQGVHITLDHVGHYVWRSEVLVARSHYKSAGWGYGLSGGTARVTNGRLNIDESPGRQRATITFDVTDIKGTPVLSIPRVVATKV